MPYAINKYNGTLIATVADGTIDNTTDLKFIGKNYAGYGEVQNENFLFLLENFANNSPPPRPLSGQVWFDTANGKLKFYDGNKFRTTGGAEIGASEPVGLTVGDFWFDTVNKQLYAYNGSTYTLIGPQGVAGQGTTQMRSRNVRDTLGNPHAIIEAITDDNTIFIISPDSTFTLDVSANDITGFTKVRKGVTLAYTTNDEGRTTSDYSFFGTASSALGITDASRTAFFGSDDFIKAATPEFVNLAQFSDQGFTVGSPGRLKIYNSGGTVPTIINQLSESIVFQTTVSSTTKTPLKLVGTDLLPGADLVSDIGSNSFRYRTITAQTFNGTAVQADSLSVSGTYRTASVTASPSTIAVRTTSDEVISGTTITAGALKATYFVGTATSANYADLAEKYLADAEYEVGTVVMVGGEKEVTAAQVGFRALGAVSGKPAYLMNFELENGTPVALKGRVPVKVSGSVIKGQRLVAGPNGTAQAAFGNNADTFAIALESNDDVNVKLVECVIL